MATAGTTRGDEVRIRLRLDTSAAEADLSKFQGKLTSVTQRVGAIGGGPGAGGGVLGGLMNLSAVGLGGLATGAAFGAPIARDVAGLVNGVVGRAGSYITEQMGLAGGYRRVEANARATDATVQTLGMAALNMSDAQINAVRNQYRSLYGKEVEAENRVRKATIGSEVSENAGELARLGAELLAALAALTLALGGLKFALNRSPF